MLFLAYSYILPFNNSNGTNAVIFCSSDKYSEIVLWFDSIEFTNYLFIRSFRKHAEKKGNRNFE